MTGVLLLSAFFSLLGTPAEGSCLDRSFTFGTYVEEAVVIEQGTVRLAGRLLRPNRPGPHPGVVLIPGGGKRDKVNYPPRYVATLLARCGVAALVYDKRGTGRSEGTWAATTFEDLIGDAAAALDVLRRQSGIDTTQIGLIGFSQGGRFAPVVAARTPGVAFVATAASPFLPVRETRLHALRSAYAHLGYSRALQARLERLWAAFFDRLARGAPTNDLDAERNALSHVPAPLLPPPSYAVERSPLLNALGQDHVEAFRGLRVPFFAIYGARDQVVPVEASLQRLREVLGPEGTAQLHVVVVPDADHSFTYAAYGRPRFRFEERLIAWVLAQVGRLEECALPLAAAVPGRAGDAVLEEGCAEDEAVGTN